MSWVEDTSFRLQGFAVLMMFICPGFLIWMAGQTKRQIASNSWPSVIGEIQDTVAKSWWDEDDKITKYYGRVVVRYTVDGQEHTSDLTDLGPGTKRMDQNAALADVSHYQAGTEVPVYYDPAAPEAGIIVKGIPTIHLVLLIVMLVGSIVSPIVSFFIIRGWIRALKKSKPDAA